MTAPAPPSVVLIADTAESAASWAARLPAAGVEVRATKLVHDAQPPSAECPDADALFCVSMALDDAGVERIAEMLRQTAHNRAAREQALRDALATAQQRLSERQLVDRAKGLLMRGRAMSEDEAFGVLRSASMQAHLRVGEVSGRVIEAARDADAVNRAGQLRMLSQRIVKLAALRAAGIEPKDTRERLDVSVARTEQQLDQLGRALADDAVQGALDRVRAAWRLMAAALAQRPEAAQLAAFDSLAERLLEQADALARALQSRAPSVQVVNLCGRQRMLAQRFAKQALLATLLPEPEAGTARAAALETDAEFQRALAALTATPIATPQIRAALDDAERQWQQLRAALRDAHTGAGRHVIAQASEALAARFDELTERYEHSLQVILG